MKYRYFWYFKLVTGFSNAIQCFYSGFADVGLALAARHLGLALAARHLGLALAARHLGLALAARQIEVIRVWVLVGIRFKQKNCPATSPDP